MNIKTPLLGASLFVTLFCLSAHAVSYTTGFDLPGYSGAATLSGQENWDTNNYSDNSTPGDFSDDLGQSDYVGEIPGYSSAIGDNWAAIGGLSFVPPVVDTSFLFVPLNLSDESAIVFNVSFGITSSGSPNFPRDTFGWTFRNLAGDQLLRVAFIPDADQASELTIRVFNSVDGELAGSGLTNIAYDSPYDLSVSISGSGLVSVSIRDVLANPPVHIVTDELADGAIPSAISDIAATWSLTDTTADPNGQRNGFGSNALLFDNYSVVPEPTTTALFILGGCALTRRQRRADRGNL